MRRFLLLILSLASGFAADQAAAVDLGSKGTRFGLELQNYTAKLLYDQGEYRTHIEGFSIYFTEPVSDNMEIGIDLGRIFMSQDGNPDSLDAAPGGGLLGLWWQLNWTPTDIFGLHLHAGVRHHQAGDGSDPDRKVRFEWQEYDVRLLTSLKFGRVELVAGGLYQDLSGTQRNDGTSSASWSFTTDPGLELQLQLNLLVEGNGRAGIRLEREGEDSAHRRISLCFETRY